MTTQKDTKIKIAFVCLGNICRSPLAWAIFKAYLENYFPHLVSLFVIDSAGTSSSQQGRPVDWRSYRVAMKNEHRLQGVCSILKEHVAKQVTGDILSSFDYIIGMDENNERNLISMAEKAGLHGSGRRIEERVALFGKFCSPSSSVIIRDPYLGEESDFQVVYDQCLEAASGFCSHLLATRSLQ